MTLQALLPLELQSQFKVLPSVYFSVPQHVSEIMWHRAPSP